MRIGILIHELLVQGGTERQCVSLARELMNLGHEVVVFASAYDRDNCFAEVCRDVEVRVAGRGFPLKVERPLMVRRFSDMVVLTASVERAMEDGLDLHVLHPHHWPPHWAAVNAKHHAHVPVVWMCNDVPDAHQRSQRAGLGRLWAKAWYRAIYHYDTHVVRQIDRTVVLDDRIRALLSKTYHIDTIDVVRSGVDLEKFSTKPVVNPIRSRYRIREDAFLVLCLSILLPHRRLEDGVKAIAILRDKGVETKLLVVGSLTGDPAYVQMIRNTIKTYDVANHVILAGAVGEEDIAACYHACDAFLFPNEEQTWGLAVIEAMTCGKPAIVSTGSGVHEVLEDGMTAMLVPPRSPEAIAGRIQELILSPDLARSIAANGSKFVHGRFSWQRFAEDMVEVFEHVAHK